MGWHIILYHWSIYDGHLRVQLSRLANMDVRILHYWYFVVDGGKWDTQRLPASNNEFGIPVNQLNSNIYEVIMNNKAKVFSEKLKKMHVAALRMVTGEELLARVKNVTAETVDLDQPRVLIAQLRQKPDGTPFMAAQVLNWINADPDATVTVVYDDVVAVTEPESGMQKEYIRFTTGIELASASSIIK